MSFKNLFPAFAVLIISSQAQAAGQTSHSTVSNVYVTTANVGYINFTTAINLAAVSGCVVPAGSVTRAAVNLNTAAGLEMVRLASAAVISNSPVVFTVVSSCANDISAWDLNTLFLCQNASTCNF